MAIDPVVKGVSIQIVTKSYLIIYYNYRVMQFNHLYDLLNTLLLVIVVLGILLPRSWLPYYMVLLAVLFFNSMYNKNSVFVRESSSDPLFSHLIDLATGVQLNRDQYERITDLILVLLFVIALARYTEFITGSVVINNQFKLNF